MLLIIRGAAVSKAGWSLKFFTKYLTSSLHTKSQTPSSVLCCCLALVPAEEGARVLKVSGVNVKPMHLYSIVNFVYLLDCIVMFEIKIDC